MLAQFWPHATDICYVYWPGWMCWEDGMLSWFRIHCISGNIKTWHALWLSETDGNSMLKSIHSRYVINKVMDNVRRNMESERYVKY